MTHPRRPAMTHQPTAGDALFRPVRTGNALEETVERLLASIRLGVLGVGEQFPPERDLAGRLAVSRVTLREAIRALQDAGYVTSIRGRYGGTFVCATIPESDLAEPHRNPADLEDALTLRAILEAGAADHAAACRLSWENCHHLHASLTDTAESELADYRRKDSRLHLAIAEVTGSPSLVTAVADVRMRLNTLLDAIPLLERNIDHSNHQHAVIVEAIVDGDSGAARAAMAEHLEGTASLLRGFLA